MSRTYFKNETLISTNVLSFLFKAVLIQIRWYCENWPSFSRIPNVAGQDPRIWRWRSFWWSAIIINCPCSTATELYSMWVKHMAHISFQNSSLQADNWKITVSKALYATVTFYGTYAIILNILVSFDSYLAFNGTLMKLWQSVWAQLPPLGFKLKDWVHVKMAKNRSRKMRVF